MSTPAEDADDLGQAPPPRWLLKAYTHVNVWVYKLSGGRMMNTLAGMPIVLIKMTRARSGTPTTIPLMYVPHKDGVVLVASQGGLQKTQAGITASLRIPRLKSHKVARHKNCAPGASAMKKRLSCGQPV